MTTVDATTEVERQLAAAGILGDILEPRVVIDPESGHVSVRGRLPNLIVAARLRQDRERFLEGPLHLLHPDVGPKRLDFRSIGGTFGEGSLQIVIGQVWRLFYADIDAHNPYADAVGWVGHAREVVANLWRRARRVWRA